MNPSAPEQEAFVEMFVELQCPSAVVIPAASAKLQQGSVQQPGHLLDAARLLLLSCSYR